MTPPSTTMLTDVAIVGGGPAGLQAGLTLGRLQRATTVVDSGEYRNATAHQVHNVLGAEGITLTQLRSRWLADLERSTAVTMLRSTVTTITPQDQRFLVRLRDGGELRASALILATGMQDELPPIPGLADAWGDRIVPCPTCHAQEYAGQRIGILGTRAALHHAPVLLHLAGQVLVFTNGEALADDLASALVGVGAEIVEGWVAKIARSPAGLSVSTGAGQSVELAALFLHPPTRQRAPFAADLGLDLHSSGCVRIDEGGATSLAGVFAAGDMAHPETAGGPMSTVLQAMAAGQRAAGSAHRYLWERG